MTRVVFDTNVVISAMLWGGKPLDLLTLARDRRIFAFTSRPLLDEFIDVIGRDKLAYKVSVARGGVAALVADYRLLCRIVDVLQLASPIAPDPDDDWVIATAIAAKADMIVTGDKPFLGVGTVGSMRIVTVGEALLSLNAP